ncbi:MAG: hypothetical protein WKF84_24885 [Pyrinomonadaceae bacterium]
MIVPQAVITELERGRAGTQVLAREAERPAWLEVLTPSSAPSPLLPKRIWMRAKRR